MKGDVDLTQISNILSHEELHSLLPMLYKSYSDFHYSHTHSAKLRRASPPSTVRPLDRK